MNYPQDFIKCHELNLWLPKSNRDNFAYSDGFEEEAYLENCLKGVSDLSCHSSELAGYIRNWPSEYHLSPKRSNLLRPLLLGPDISVLELGAGCGSITRYLGEKVAKVIAVEGSEKRSKIAALRCKDLENVQIVHDNFQDIEISEKFDVVTLIGVLEYSGKYLKSENPYQQALEIARDYLKSDGVLVLAIENKLGLKYFAGCSEDHTSILFDGLENYSSGSLVRTFGRQELEELLKCAGFSDIEFLYPFPDYKIPDVILRLDGLDESKQHYSKPFLYNWLGYINSRDYSDRKIEIFQEFLVAKEIEANGFLHQLSNSFLVVASVGQAGIEKYLETQVIAWKYNVMRHKKFMTQVCLISNKDDASLFVKREPIYPELVAKEQEQGRKLKHYAYESTDFVSGTSLIEQMIRAIKSKALGDEEPFKLCINIWYKFLVEDAQRLLGSTTDLPGRYIDCTPWNLVVTPRGDIKYIDREWSYWERLPIKFILFRGLFAIYYWFYPWIDAIWEGLLPDKSLRSFIDFCLKLIPIELEIEELNEFIKLDWEFQTQVKLVFGENLDDFVKFLNQTPQSMLAIKSIERTQLQLQQTQVELEQSQNQLQNTQTEYERLRSHIQQIEAEYKQLESYTQQLESHTQQLESHTQQLESHTHHTDTQLEQVQSQLQSTQLEMGQAQSHLQSSYIELKQTQSHLQQTQNIIEAMQSSKFWKLRTQWLKLKKLLTRK